MGTRLSVQALARHFSLSSERIYQLVRSGQLKKGADRRIDLAEAEAWRQTSISTHPTRTLATANSNGRFISEPKGIALLMSDADFDRDLFGDDAAPAAPVAPRPVSSVRDTVQRTVDGANILVELRQEELRLRIDQRKQKALADAGMVIERAVVRNQGMEAGKIIMGLLNGLPTEIAGIFVEPERRAEVRAKIQERVDQMAFALHASLAQATGDP